MDRIKRAALSPFVWMLVTMILLSLAANRWIEVEGAREAVSQWGVWAPVVSALVKTLTNVTPFGAIVLSVVNGALFSLLVATLVNLISSMLAGLIMYRIWQRGDHEWDIRARIQAMPIWLRRYQADNLLFLTLLRWVPWAGGSLADLIAGSHHVPLRIHVASLLLGYLPGALIYALIGAKLVSM
ncbi:MAG: VTT domain-containing protein [Gammaproteobacteria bacterium]|nr:VTT domain-containing protein [Gammaproteobacteria bacterium]